MVMACKWATGPLKLDGLENNGPADGTVPVQAWSHRLGVPTETAGALLRAEWRSCPSHSPPPSSLSLASTAAKPLRRSRHHARRRRRRTPFPYRERARLPLRLLRISRQCRGCDLSLLSRARPEMEVAAEAGGEDCLIEIHPGELRFLCTCSLASAPPGALYSPVTARRLEVAQGA